MSVSRKKLLENRPVWLTVFWCDRCNRAINQNEEDHFHAEQCGSCKKFLQIDADWGYCKSQESVYGDA